MHGLIVGVSNTGKSTLAFELARAHQRRSEPVLVLDPNNDPRWPADYKTTDPERFLAVAKRSQRCALFVDEAGKAIGRGAKAQAMAWLTTTARHWGHRTFLIAQRAQQVEPTLRDQCSEAFVFRQSLRDAKLLADQFADETLLQAATLPQGTFIHAISCQGARVRRLAL